jgi:hypothetical protein
MSDFHVAEMQRYDEENGGRSKIKESFLARARLNRGATTMVARGKRV